MMQVTEMMENVIEDFADTVKQMDWLDPTTSNTVLIKLKAMRYSVGFPSWLFTAGKLDEYYKYVSIVMVPKDSKFGHIHIIKILGNDGSVIHLCSVAINEL